MSENNNRKSRSSEKIREDHAKYSKCFKCDTPLKKTNYFRFKPVMCNDCRGEANSNNSTIREIQKEMKLLPPSHTELGDGTMFEDDPIAVKEEDNARYSRVAPEVHFGVSDISSIMSSNPYNKYKPKIGSARDGVRYKRKNYSGEP